MAYNNVYVYNSRSQDHLGRVSMLVKAWVEWPLSVDVDEGKQEVRVSYAAEERRGAGWVDFLRAASLHLLQPMFDQSSV